MLPSALSTFPYGHPSTLSSDILCSMRARRLSATKMLAVRDGLRNNAPIGNLHSAEVSHPD